MSEMPEEYSEFEDESDGLFAEESESDAVLGSVLGAEDEDEFLGKLFGAVKKFGPKLLSGVGEVARFAAPALKMIPHPYAQIGSQVANVLGKLRAEGATTEDALEAVAEQGASPSALTRLVTDHLSRRATQRAHQAHPVAGTASIRLVAAEHRWRAPDRKHAPGSAPA